MPASEPKIDHATDGDWVPTPEPCKWCLAVGAVRVMIDDGPEGRHGFTVMRCESCKRSWEAP